MTQRNTKFKRILSLALSVLLLISAMPFAAFTANAAENPFGRKADPSTLDGWRDYFYQDENTFNTANAGGIWTDKTVLDTNDELLALGLTENQIPDPKENGFLSVLSAIGSNMTIMGKTEVATDTVLILDTSASMQGDSATAMVDAANLAMNTLLEANPQNRVGIVFYASSASTYLPLDHYTTNSGTFLNISGNTISLDSSVLNSVGGDPTNSTRSVTGGTYMAQGLIEAIDTFEAATLDPATARKPIILFMTDGAPTFADTDFTNPPSSGSNDLGDGGNSDTSDELVFATELSASYAKGTVSERYKTAYGANFDALFYTVGLTEGVSNDWKECVLNPTAANNDNIKTLWDDYTSAAVGSQIMLEDNFGTWWDISVTKAPEPPVLTEKYVNGYYAAQNAGDLVNAFEQALTEISLQTIYSPTLIEGGDASLSGYISFVDKIGRYMEVTGFRGLIIGNKLYTGSQWARALTDGSLGTVQRPTDLGDNLVWSMAQRLGIDNTTARSLIDSAYTAGQMYYNSDTDFSNYFGWYSDADNNFLGFYSKGSTVPEGAVYTNKSYLYLGAPDEKGVYDAGMMYATVRVRETITTGDQEVDFAIPASLVPAVTYQVKLDVDENVEDLSILDPTVTPIRLVYETELNGKINKWTANEIVDSAYRNPPRDNNETFKDGTLYFYNNKWDFDGALGYGTFNPYSYYSPSYENDRHYYREDAVLYVKEGESYVLYTGTKPTPNDGTTYYYGPTVYYKNGVNSFSKDTPFEPLRSEVINAVETGDGFYYIPKGYIRRTYADYQAPKAENASVTHNFYASPYSDYSVGNANSNEAGHYSIVGTTLGNNGRLQITPEIGVKITKKLAEGVTTDRVFKFNVVSSNTEVTSREVMKVNADGTTNETTLSFQNGRATVELKADESLYIGDMKAGETVTVTEALDFDYALQSLTVDGEEDADKVAEVTLTDSTMANLVFTNAERQKGSITVVKRVTHPYGDTYTTPTDKLFPINLHFSFNNEDLADYEITDPNNASAKTDKDGNYSISLNHTGSVIIGGIPEGTVVTVTEDTAELPNYTVSYNETSGTANDGEVTVTTTTTVTVINDYKPTPETVSAEFTLNVTKSFDQQDHTRAWLDGDVFDFTLYKHENGGWVPIGAKQLKVDSENNTKKIGTTETIGIDFTDLFKDEKFSAPGTYLYHVREEGGSIPGVNYDTSTHRFQVVVEDNNLSGSLKITKVESLSDNRVVVEKNGDNYNINTVFVNDYNPADAIVNLEVQKRVKDVTGSKFAAPSGFKFKIAQVDSFEDKVDWDSATTIADATSTTGVLKYSLKFEDEGTYRYKVKEINDSRAGWSYDETERHVTIVVSNYGNGALSAVAYEGTEKPNNASSTVVLGVENEYTATANVEVNFADKILEGRDAAADEFTFYVVNANAPDVILATGKNNAAEAGKETDIVFDKRLTFNALGEYRFKIYEETTKNLKNGVTYDKTVYDFTVTVTDGDTEGTLKTALAVNNGTNDVTFKNIYKAADGKLTLTAKKNFSGRELIANEFTFNMIEANADGTPKTGAEAKPLYHDKNGNIVFEEMTFKAEGTHYYLITEYKPTELMGVTYDESKYLVKVVVSDDTDAGEFKATAAYKKQAKGETGWSDVDEISFNNTYKAEPTAVTFRGTKVESDGELKDKEYSFTLYNATEAWELDGEIETVQNGTPNQDGAAEFVFTTIDYTTVGVRRYIVKEAIPATKATGITYDEQEYRITVTVTDNGRGLLTPAVVITRKDSSFAPKIEFDNKYAAALGTSVTVEGNKALNFGAGTDAEFQDFTFTFEAVEADESFVAGSTVKASANADSNKKFSLKLDFDAEDLGETFYYVIREKDLGIVGMTYSDTEYHLTVKIVDETKDGVVEAKYTLTDKDGGNVTTADFTNEYKIVTFDKFSVEGEKILEGRDLKADEFKFDLYDAEDKLVTSVKNKADGSFKLEDIEVKSAGTHVFTIVEDDSATVKKAGVTYDPKEYTVTVTVEDQKNGTLKVTDVKTALGGNDADVVFTNTYEAAESDRLVIKGVKELDGRTQTAGEFEFKLLPADENFVIDEQADAIIGTNKADGTIEFTGITYAMAGTFYYVAIEDDTVNLERMTFDDTEYLVTVTVIDDTENGKLVADYEVKKEITDTESTTMLFKNTFTPRPDDITVYFDVNKTVVNKGSDEISGAGFDFLLEKKGSDTPSVVTADANGKARFTLIFSEDDIGNTYNYRISEVNDERDYVTYSEEEYLVTVKITLDGNNKLVATLTLDEEPVDAVVTEFTNEYNYSPPETPKTGDTKTLTLWFTLLFAGLATLIAMPYLRRKKAN